MKKIASLLSLLCIATLLQAATVDDDLAARTEAWLAEHPHSLPHWLTPEELTRLDEIGRDFYPTEPPLGPVHNIAEFERMQSVLVRYPFGISYSLIAEMSQECGVTTIVTNQSQENTVRSYYTSYGVNLANCDFIHAPTDSYWSRDYGPWFVIDGNGDFGVCNFPYNRPRPNDNDIPIEVASHLGIDLYGMNVIHTGGNYMTDGLGISSSSTLVWDENPGLTHAQIDQYLLDYCGIGTYHVVEDPNNTYIDHIDCWGKFLAPEKVLIREVAPSHAQYDEIEATAAYYAAQTCSWGVPYEVYRVYTPQNQPYTNSLILNDRVFVPITGSSWDDDALASYEAAMPGYEVLGFTGSWESTDALHCRAKGIADLGLLLITHQPLLGNQPAGVPYDITAQITAYSGQPLLTDQLRLYYRVDGSPYNEVPLTQSGDDWIASIPAQTTGAEIGYYLHAADASGRSANHPFIGAPDPHLFYVGGPIPPELEVTPTTIDITLPPDATTQEFVYVSNIGGGSLDWTLELVEIVPPRRDISGSFVDCIPIIYAPGQTGIWTLSVYNNSPDDEWLTDVWVTFPVGVTITGASGFTGGTGGDMIWDGTTGQNVTVNWHGEDGSGWGVVRDGEYAWAEVTLTFGDPLPETIDFPYAIQGDNYGGTPHYIEGFFTLMNYGDPMTWISADPTSGQVGAGETDTVTLDLNSIDLDYGWYMCEVVVNQSQACLVTLEVANLDPVPPDDLQITVYEDQLYLYWTEVPGATSYKVYSSGEPYSGFTEDLSGVLAGPTWQAPLPVGPRFYQVTTVVE